MLGPLLNSLVVLTSILSWTLDARPVSLYFLRLSRISQALAQSFTLHPLDRDPFNCGYGPSCDNASVVFLASGRFPPLTSLNAPFVFSFMLHSGMTTPSSAAISYPVALLMVLVIPFPFLRLMMFLFCSPLTMTLPPFRLLAFISPFFANTPSVFPLIFLLVFVFVRLFLLPASAFLRRYLWPASVNTFATVSIPMPTYPLMILRLSADALAFLILLSLTVFAMLLAVVVLAPVLAGLAELEKLRSRRFSRPSTITSKWTSCISLSSLPTLSSTH